MLTKHFLHYCSLHTIRTLLFTQQFLHYSPRAQLVPNQMNPLHIINLLQLEFVAHKPLEDNEQSIWSSLLDVISILVGLDDSISLDKWSSN